MLDMGNFAKGKVTFASGWGAIVSGLSLASAIVAEQLGDPSATTREILVAVLGSQVPFLIFGGSAIIGAKRAWERKNGATPEEKEERIEKLREQLKSTLNEIESMK